MYTPEELKALYAILYDIIECEKESVRSYRILEKFDPGYQGHLQEHCLKLDVLIKLWGSLPKLENTIF